MKTKYFIVNATSLDRSGALNILRQFIENIPEDENQWLVFISDNITLPPHSKNVRLEPVSGVKPMYKRLWWDTYGLKKWLQKNGIEPLAAISLQNTGFHVGYKVPKYIYFHQSIPFSTYKWNPFRRKERIFWFYKKIYPLCVKLFLKKDTIVFVQLEYIKKCFASYFKHAENRIEVYAPSLPKLYKQAKPNKLQDECNAIKLFYPAYPHIYKNHKIIEKAVELIDKDIRVIFTIDPINNNYTDPRIECIGTQPVEKIVEYYQTCDSLLFPSFIETFGLPLIEAAQTGMHIIVADLPYAREVLKGYAGVEYVEFDNPSQWANAINRVIKDKRYPSITLDDNNSWKQLFNRITTQISN